MKEKYQAIFVGCAIGDTLGMPVETWSKERIRKYRGVITEPIAPWKPVDKEGNEIKEDEYGKIRYYAGGLDVGDYTDDTILTFSLARSLIEKGLDLEHAAKGQLHEYEIRLNPDGTYRGGFGTTTVDGFKNIQKGISPLESGVIGGPGNAPAMKMAPLGIYMHATNTAKEGLEFAEKVGRITHLDPRSVASGVVHAQAIYSLLQQIDKSSFNRLNAELCKEWEQPLTEEFIWHAQGSLYKKLNWIENHEDATVEDAFRYLGNSSSVYRSYPFALFMFQKFWDSPLEGLLETVNYGGDCDTTGAIYGTLMGARHGMVFPKKWLDVTKGVSEGIALGNSFYELRNKNTGWNK